MSYVNPTQSVALRRVQESWHDSNKNNYAWAQLGIGSRVLGKRSNHSGVTTYQLPALDNALLNTPDGRTWNPGDDPGPVRANGEVSITITLKNEANPTTGYVVPRGGERNRFADAQKQTPLHLSQLYARRNNSLYSLLTGGTFGSFSFTGTEPLSARNTTGDASPIHDINTKILGFDFYRLGLGLELAMICDKRFLLAAATHPAYTGGGQGDLAGGSGSGTAGGLPPLEIINRLKAQHSLDKLVVVSSAANAAAYGQAASIGYTATGAFCFVGLVQPGMFDLTSDTGSGPDGAFGMGYEFDPWVDNWRDPAAEMDYWKGKDAFHFYPIRGSVMGACFTGNITA